MRWPEWRFPYHFIDFETAAVALPFHAGMRPYQSVAFQFSHHVMDANGEIRHVGQFLCAEPGVFPNYDFARALMRELNGDDGTVFMWSHHENTILNAIARQLMEDENSPDDREELMSFLGRLTKGGDRAMVDLCDLAGKAYFHPDTMGSSSIKKVLPAILKGSDELKAKYSQPIYGAPGGMPSLNFTSPEGFAWIDVSADGMVSDPYGRLKAMARDMLPEGVDVEAGDDSIIAEGGAAATAYSRLQFEQMDAQTGSESSLLYCATASWTPWRWPWLSKPGGPIAGGGVAVTCNTVTKGRETKAGTGEMWVPLGLEAAGGSAYLSYFFC